MYNKEITFFSIFCCDADFYVSVCVTSCFLILLLGVLLYSMREQKCLFCSHSIFHFVEEQISLQVHPFEYFSSLSSGNCNVLCEQIVI